MSIEHLPTDLILHILSRLPANSIARCRCVSKRWASLLTLGCPYFTELFSTQSKTRPLLLFAVQKYDKWLLYSCPRPQISYKNSESSLSVTAEFHMSLDKDLNLQSSLPVSGLIYFPNMRDNYGRNSSVLCNPSTGQILWLPELKVGENDWVCSFVGYDPIDKQFAVLSISYPVHTRQQLPLSYQILKIGSGKELVWRNLECPLRHIPLHLSTYVNGVLYYITKMRSPDFSKIVCFDIKSEKFKFIDHPWLHEPHVLINLKGKLCGITKNWVEFGERYNLQLRLWILDFEKQKWSQHLYPLPLWLCRKTAGETYVFVDAVSVTGEIVLNLCHTSNPICVYFFNPEKNSLQKVEIKGVGEFESTVGFAYVNHVEDLRIFELGF